MDTNENAEISNYIELINKSFSKIIKEYSAIQLQDHTKDTLTKSNNLLTNGEQLLDTLKSNLKSIETVLSNCDIFVREVEDNLAFPRKSDDYVFHTKNGMLAYPGKEYITRSTKTEKKTIKIKKQEPERKKIQITELGYELEMPIITDLNKLPDSIYYYDNSKNPQYKSGLYIKLNQNCIKIPFPEVVDSKKEFDRKHSIRCKYHTKQECDMQRQKMASLHNSTVRICNFAHESDQIIKIGYQSRCPSVPNFGNPATMPNDIKNITVPDIKNLLLYGLSDLGAALVWLDFTKSKGKTLDSLEFCK